MPIQGTMRSDKNGTLFLSECSDVRDDWLPWKLHCHSLETLLHQRYV